MQKLTSSAKPDPLSWVGLALRVKIRVKFGRVGRDHLAALLTTVHKYLILRLFYQNFLQLPLIVLTLVIVQFDKNRLLLSNQSQPEKSFSKRTFVLWSSSRDMNPKVFSLLACGKVGTDAFAHSFQ